MPLPFTSTRIALIWYVEEAAQFEGVPCCLVDMLESVGSEMDPSKISCHHYEDVLDFLYCTSVHSMNYVQIEGRRRRAYQDL